MTRSQPRRAGLAAGTAYLQHLRDRQLPAHGCRTARSASGVVDLRTLEVTAVLEWEHAHAGHPRTDLGNLLRFERHPAYVSAVLDTWVSLRGGEGVTVLDGARSADLWALVDLASRAGENPVADRAEELLRAVADAGDVHAWPFGG